MPKMSPLHLNLMMHYHCGPAPYAVHEPMHANSQSVQRCRMDLIRLGLLTGAPERESGFKTTLDGDVWCERLCQLAGWIA